MNRNRINGQTIRILEEEGLGPAVNLVGKLLDGHGSQKHGHKRWSQLRYLQLLRKCVRHMMSEGRDDESGEYHSAHGVARALMVLALEIQFPEKGDK